jgi:hypothetical protein
MRILSSQSVAIRMAKQNGTLRVTEEFNARLGTPYWSICDDRGLIEVAMSKEEADKLIAE